LQDPEEPYDASWERNVALVREAERLGYDSTLVAQHTINPHHAPMDRLEAWTSSAALAAVTNGRRALAAMAAPPRAWLAATSRWPTGSAPSTMRGSSCLCYNSSRSKQKCAALPRKSW
jgi:phosphopantothenoylcysteine synthetase/decarboxylase